MMECLSSQLSLFRNPPIRWPRLEVSSLLPYLVLLWVNLPHSGTTGYCQVYSYNIKHRSSATTERHFFVCCSNLKERTCQGHTYQKPVMSQSFCTGQVLQRGGSHWTQIETRMFPGSGRFYCGGCCGQHLASGTCNAKMKGKWPGCMNWVQCFQNECRAVVEAVFANQQIACPIPPPPHPKHFVQYPRTLPPNLTLEMGTTPKPNSFSPAYNTSAKCSSTWCKTVDLETRCTTQCCLKYCCLPDSEPFPESHDLLWGMTTIQVIGIVIGSLVLLAAVAAISMLLLKRCVPGCRNFHLAAHQDAQILVIEEPDEVDSEDPDIDSG